MLWHLTATSQPEGTVELTDCSRVDSVLMSRLQLSQHVAAEMTPGRVASQSKIEFMFDLSAWLQSVSSAVSSDAAGQLSCTLLAVESLCQA